jgi:predicted nucleic acid-binding protein
MNNLVFDTWALIAFFKAEAPAAQRVQALLRDVLLSNRLGFMALINLGEVYYICGRLKGVAWATQKLSELRALPLIIVPIDEQSVLQAATYKMTYPISYADAFALTCAVQQKATLVTGDPELGKLTTLVAVEMLPRR